MPSVNVPVRRALLLAVTLAGGGAFVPALAQQPAVAGAASPPPRPPTFAPPPPPAAPAAATVTPATPVAAPATVPAPVYKPATVAASSRPPMSPGAISRSMSREVHSLLYRLDQRLQQFTRDYNRPPATRPTVQQLDFQLDEIENLLAQLHRHPLPSERQTTLFKTEMNLRKLRESTVPDL